MPRGVYDRGESKAKPRGRKPDPSGRLPHPSGPTGRLVVDDRVSLPGTQEHHTHWCPREGDVWECPVCDVMFYRTKEGQWARSES